MIFEELGDFVDSLADGDNRVRSFGGPVEIDTRDVPFAYDTGPVRPIEVGLRLVDADDPDISITVAFADLLRIELGANAGWRGGGRFGVIGDVAGHLAHLHFQNSEYRPTDIPMTPEFWGTIFNGDELEYGPDGLPIAEAFGLDPHMVGSVLIVRDLFVDKSFRGRGLGALLASSIVQLAYLDDQLDPPTLILGYPRFGRNALQRGHAQLLAAARTYWSAQLGLSDLGGIYGMLTNVPDIAKANAVMNRHTDDLDAGYIAVDCRLLRERLVADDPTLWPRSRGVLPALCPGLHDDDDDYDDGDDDDDDAAIEGLPHDLDQMARVLTSIDADTFPDATAQVATIVRFFADDQASAFHDAAAYLFDHPDFEVQAVAVNYDDANLAHCLALTVLADSPDF